MDVVHAHLAAVFFRLPKICRGIRWLTNVLQRENISQMMASICAIPANTVRTCWIPCVNNLGKFGRWAFAEFTSVFEIDADFDKLIESAIAAGKNHMRSNAPKRYADLF